MIPEGGLMLNIRTHIQGKCSGRSFTTAVWRISVVLMLVLCIYLWPLASAVDAGEVGEGNNMWTKLGRGLSNIIICPVELFNQPSQMGKTERWPIALTGGVFKGVLFTVIRGVVGVYETVTFPVPIPEDYDPLGGWRNFLHSRIKSAYFLPRFC